MSTKKERAEARADAQAQADMTAAEAASPDNEAGGGEPDPNANDAGQVSNPELTEAEIATLGAGGVDCTESEADYTQRLAAERAEFDKIRELTPVQEIALRACPGASHLGVIIGTPEGIRCLSLCDYRTEIVHLKAGDHAQIVVLAGEGLRTWEFYRGQEARAKAHLEGGGVRTESIPGAVAAQLVGGLAVGAAPAVDPLEETQPAIGGTNEAEGGTKAANPETTAAQGS